MHHAVNYQANCCPQWSVLTGQTPQCLPFKRYLGFPKPNQFSFSLIIQMYVTCTFKKQISESNREVGVTLEVWASQSKIPPSFIEQKHFPITDYIVWEDLLWALLLVRKESCFRLSVGMGHHEMDFMSTEQDVHFLA